MGDKNTFETITDDYIFVNNMLENIDMHVEKFSLDKFIIFHIVQKELDDGFIFKLVVTWFHPVNQ